MNVLWSLVYISNFLLWSILGQFYQLRKFLSSPHEKRIDTSSFTCRKRKNKRELKERRGAINEAICKMIKKLLSTSLIKVHLWSYPCDILQYKSLGNI